ncbi:MAG TPA: nucleoside deaminase [candidate division Zixibacteria bacterium]|nr:nucleoside deaminase [candidate division Zixibacteria bacterium]
MRAALDEAEIAMAMGEVPVGCVIAKGNLVIGRAHNLRESRNDPTAHAEILALRMAGTILDSRRLDGTTLFVTLEPCPMCMSAIMLAGVSRLVYGAKDPEAGAVASQLNLANEPAFKHNIRISGGILEDECSQILRSFFESVRARI